jgi:prevent-host-death family protein
MTTYSIAEANSKLAQIVREAEEGRPVELTRRGQPVAVVLSTHEYRRLNHASTKHRDWWESYQQWRKSVDWNDFDIDDILKDVRDKSPGRDFSFEE